MNHFSWHKIFKMLNRSFHFWKECEKTCPTWSKNECVLFASDAITFRTTILFWHLEKRKEKYRDSTCLSRYKFLDCANASSVFCTIFCCWSWFLGCMYKILSCCVDLFLNHIDKAHFSVLIRVYFMRWPFQ